MPSGAALRTFGSSSHDELSAAEAELVRRREHAAAAATYRRECADAVEHTKAALDELRRQATTGLRVRLTGSSTAVLKSDEAAEAAAMAASEKARRTLAVAQAAEGEIAAGVSEAEADTRACKTVVERAALAVIEETRIERQTRLRAAEQAADRLRATVSGLHVDTRYPAIHWPKHLQELLVDPEADIVGDKPDLPA